MLETLKAIPAQLEQYKMILRIVELWTMFRTPTIIALVFCLLLTIFLFMKKGYGRNFFFILTIILAIITGGMDWFKNYVDHRKKEMARETIMKIPEQIGKIAETVTKPITEPLKKALPFGK